MQERRESKTDATEPVEALTSGRRLVVSEPNGVSFVSSGGAACALAVSRRTISRWVKDGLLEAVRRPSRHYTDERPRMHPDGYRLWITVESVERLIARALAGTTVKLPRPGRRWRAKPRSY